MELKKIPTKEEIENLEKIGFRIETSVMVKCDFCNEEFTGKTEKEVRNKLTNHLDNKCSVAKFLRNFKPEVKMREIGLYIQLADKINNGKANTKEISDFIVLAKRIRKRGI